ncbi:MAG: cation diffusion facilitator family transporter [Dehalococcoidia bacterium]
MAEHAGHSHATTDARRLRMALTLVVATAVLELWGGITTHSLALLADFGHVASDVAALTLALVAVRVAQRPHTMQWTFGFHRAEVLAATANGLGLLAIAAFIAAQAVGRLRDPAPEVGAVGLIVIAAIGLVANLVAAWLLGHGESMNMRAARLHVLFDLAGSVIAVTAGLVIAPTGWTWVDPALSLASVVLLVIAAVGVLRGTLAVLMEAVPAGVDLRAVDHGLRSISGIVAVHDMHCWSISTGVIAFAAHVEVAPGHNPQFAVQRATTLLRDRFGIGHDTLQAEVIPVHRPAAPFLPDDPAAPRRIPTRRER